MKTKCKKCGETILAVLTFDGKQTLVDEVQVSTASLKPQDDGKLKIEDVHYGHRRHIETCKELLCDGSLGSDKPFDS